MSALPIECPREADLFEAVAFGRWPAQTASELRAHVDACAVCRDLAEVAGALQADRRALVREAQPPTAGAVWWRATIRARAEAARIAMQPITVWQGIAAACLGGVGVALGGGLWRTTHAAGHIAAAVASLLAARADATTAAIAGFEHAALLLVGLVACLLLAPLALYITLGDD